MKQAIIGIIAAITLILTSCTPVDTTEYVESGVIFRTSTVTAYETVLYHVTYRGHEFIVNSNGGLIELTTQPYDTFKEVAK